MIDAKIANIQIISLFNANTKITKTYYLDEFFLLVNL